MILVIFTVTLLTLIILSIPIAFSLLLTSAVLMLYSGAFDINIIGSNLVNNINKYVLLAVPFFILTGELMTAGGLSKRIVDLAMSIVGGLRGGLGYVVIFVSVILASLSGSAVADAAALASILLPMMSKAGYDRGRSAGLIAAGGIIGPIIPPSINLILFGVIAHVSITKLFMAGIFPGLYMGIGLVSVWWFLTRHEDKRAFKIDIKEIANNCAKGAWALALPFIIVGGLRLGYFTPTETSIIAAFYTLFVGAFIYKDLSWNKLYEALLSATRLSAIVMLIVATSSVLAWIIMASGLDQDVTDFMNHFNGNEFLILLVICAITLIFGMVIDSIPLILILTPIFFPVIESVGIDKVYFGIIFVMCVGIGMLTPPVGNVLSIVATVAKMPFEKVAIGVLPFLMAEVAVIVALLLWPELVLVPAKWFY